MAVVTMSCRLVILIIAASPHPTPGHGPPGRDTTPGLARRLDQPDHCQERRIEDAARLRPRRALGVGLVVTSLPKVTGMKVTIRPSLLNSDHGLNLSPSWRTLYELAKLDKDQFEDGLAAGIIRPDMERKDAIALRRKPKGEEHSLTIVLRVGRFHLIQAAVDALDDETGRPAKPQASGGARSRACRRRRVARKRRLPWPTTPIAPSRKLAASCAARPSISRAKSNRGSNIGHPTDHLLVSGHTCFIR